MFAHYLQDALDLPRLSLAVRAREGGSVASWLREVVVLVYAVAPDAVGVVGGHLERVGDLVGGLPFRLPLIWTADVLVRRVRRAREPDACISLHHLDLWVKHGRGRGAVNGRISVVTSPRLRQVDDAGQVGVLGGERTARLLRGGVLVHQMQIGMDLERRNRQVLVLRRQVSRSMRIVAFRRRSHEHRLVLLIARGHRRRQLLVDGRRP